MVTVCNSGVLSSPTPVVPAGGGVAGTSCGACWAPAFSGAAAVGSAAMAEVAAAASNAMDTAIDTGCLRCSRGTVVATLVFRVFMLFPLICDSVRRAAASHTQELENSHRLVADQRPRPPGDAQDEADGQEHRQHRGSQSDVIAEHADQERHHRSAENSGAEDPGK